jgi:5-carboxymethyl-2-hydroxymuconate isomerase
MPHIIVEYSANVAQRTDIPELLTCLHEAALETGVFPIGGIRSRALERTTYRIADGDPRYGFVYIVMRIGQGRDQATKKAAAEAVFQAASRHLDGVFAGDPISLALEMQEIDSSLSFKRNTIHDDIKAKQATEPSP